MQSDLDEVAEVVTNESPLPLKPSRITLQHSCDDVIERSVLVPERILLLMMGIVTHHLLHLMLALKSTSTQ
ncbi:hypothetical protein Aduo_009613 [Ancylostoma duodenale]